MRKSCEEVEPLPGPKRFHATQDWINTWPHLSDMSVLQSVTTLCSFLMSLLEISQGRQQGANFIFRSTAEY